MINIMIAGAVLIIGFIIAVTIDAYLTRKRK